MKRILILMVVVMTALSACKKDVTTDPVVNDPTNGAALPLKAATYVSENYPDAVIDYFVTVTNGPAAYLVTLDTREELAFASSGDYLGRGEQFHGGTHGDTTVCEPGNGHHGGGIPVDSLPAAVQAYVTANYAGYLIRHAEYDSLCANGLDIRVMLFQQGLEPVKLYFGTDGSFIMRADRMLYTDLPQAVKDFIATAYAGYTSANRAEMFTLADATLQYGVFIFHMQVRKNVRVDAAGTFICEQLGFNHCGGHGGPGGGGHHGGGIPVDSLPAAILTYVSANYAGYIIRHAEYDSLCVEGLAIVTDIVQPGTAPVKLYFDLQGAFLLRADWIRYADIPQVVKDYITNNYAGYQVERMPVQYTLADASLQYLLELRKGHSKTKLRIDNNGLLVCLQ